MNKNTWNTLFYKGSSKEIIDHLANEMIGNRKNVSRYSSPIFLRYALLTMGDIVNILVSERDCVKNGDALFPILGGGPFGEKGCLGVFSPRVLAEYLEPECVWTLGNAAKGRICRREPIVNSFFDEKRISLLPDNEAARVRAFIEHFSRTKFSDLDNFSEKFPEEEWENLIDTGKRLVHEAILHGRFEFAENESTMAGYMNCKAFESLRRNLSRIYEDESWYLRLNRFRDFPCHALYRYEQTQEFFAPLYDFLNKCDFSNE